MRTPKGPHVLPAAALVFLCLLVSGLVAAPDPPPSPGAGGVAVQYVGVKACASCHKSKATGNQVDTWKASAHARAYETLGTDAAKAVAQKLGITSDPQTVPRCLACHTTAAGEMKSRLADSFDPATGVQCEACHGAGSEYSKIQCMIKHEAALKAGLREPDAKRCAQCHNAECPTFQGFDYSSASKTIRHPLAPL